jgi:Fic family protein
MHPFLDGSGCIGRLLITMYLDGKPSAVLAGFCRLDRR